MYDLSALLHPIFCFCCKAAVLISRGLTGQDAWWADSSQLAVGMPLPPYAMSSSG